MSEPLHLGVHIGFAKTAGATNAKTATPTGLTYTDLGAVESISLDSGITTKDVIGPKDSGGKLVRKDAFDVGRAPIWTVRIQEVGPLFFELFFGSGSVSAPGGTIVPGAATTVKGWLKVEMYGHDNTIRATVYVYIHATIASQSAGNDGVTWELTAREIETTTATGTLANLVA